MDTVTVAPDCSIMMYVIIGKSVLSYLIVFGYKYYITHADIINTDVMQDYAITDYIIRKNNVIIIFLCFMLNDAGLYWSVFSLVATSCA